jgi:hypothetical protein
MIEKILVGDIITLNTDNIKLSYPTYEDWFKFYHVKSDTYIKGLSLSEHIKEYEDEDYIVEWIAPNLFLDEILYAIIGEKSKRLFLVERKVIRKFYHTDKSYDYFHEFNERYLIQERQKLYEQIDLLKQENEKLKKKTKTTGYQMPKIENGMIGLTFFYTQDGIKKEWFIATAIDEETVKLNYISGTFDKYKNSEKCLYDFNKYGESYDILSGEVLSRIMFLCNADCINTAKDIYENNLLSTDSDITIWVRA